jgi:hypothetical protein
MDAAHSVDCGTVRSAHGQAYTRHQLVTSGGTFLMRYITINAPLLLGPTLASVLDIHTIVEYDYETCSFQTCL